MLDKSKKVFSKSNHHVFDDFTRIDVGGTGDDFRVFIYVRSGDLSMNIYQNIHSMEIEHFNLHINLTKKMCEIGNLVNVIQNSEAHGYKRFIKYGGRFRPDEQQEREFRKHIESNIAKIHKEIVDVYKILGEY